MHILLLVPTYPNKENPVAGIFYKEQINALQDMGHQVGVFVLPTMRKTLHYMTDRRLFRHLFRGFDEYKDGDIPIYDMTIGFPRTLPWIRAYVVSRMGMCFFKHYVRYNGMPDIIHSHDIIVGGLLACSIKSSKYLPIVMTEHSASFLDGTISKPNQISLVKHVLNRADHILAVGPSLASSLRAFTANKDVGVIGNLIDTEFFNVPQYFLPQTPFIFSLIALLDANKGVDILLQAFQKICNAIDVELYIGGDGAERENLQKLTSELGLNNQVKFVGLLTRAGVRDLMQSSHVIISASYVETFGITLIEALACGKPVIATQSGGPSAFVNKNNGLFVPPGDVDALADAMQKLMKNYQNYNSIDIRTECVAKFSKEAFTQRLVSLYQEVLREKGFNKSK